MRINVALSLSQLSLLVLASEVKNIVIFGDSNSDVGNGQRWCNGPLWNEYLASSWNATLYNFAYSGSVCDNNMYPKTKQYIPSFKDQVEGYYKLELNLNSSETVYGVWFGLHDINKMSKKKEVDFKQIAECIGQQLRSINKVFQANKFIIFNIPPLEYMPYYLNTDQATEKNQAAVEINKLLEKDIANLNRHHHALEMDLVDINSLVNDIIVNPALFNYKQTSIPITSDCTDCPDDHEYLWWDHTHFSTAFHKTIATSIIESASFTPRVNITKEPTVHSRTYEIRPSKGIIEGLVKEYDQSKNKLNMTYETILEEDIYYITQTYANNQQYYLFLFLLFMIAVIGYLKLYKRMKYVLFQNNQET
ncbi:hypothetical protein BCV72DRAFT_224488 [Rhizopus microsporus var. microsporus]|uniref:SGNH hydrolase n=2 Tax=Rhizopus microsporus TaxID=58291 RepID=A0A2G4T3P7_RHIZD|nr:uncharacterized protein RHIMIDRAFT_273092 [Rhizopus microsporus ATCC 52813]ORE08744.1 hypothetical protein BCV72DRAFT_224488 [Rhizopus microsporus var. microsporus]PHZ15634.1 hypothetical protein RHIMIDRAFT_273092 [Rhizopus microsporus ATCC 52813]